MTVEENPSKRSKQSKQGPPPSGQTNGTLGSK